jgi:hypothetical protein
VRRGGVDGSLYYTKIRPPGLKWFFSIFRAAVYGSGKRSTIPGAGFLNQDSNP